MSSAKVVVFSIVTILYTNSWASGRSMTGALCQKRLEEASYNKTPKESQADFESFLRLTPDQIFEPAMSDSQLEALLRGVLMSGKEGRIKLTFEKHTEIDYYLPVTRLDRDFYTYGLGRSLEIAFPAGSPNWNLVSESARRMIRLLIHVKNKALIEAWSDPMIKPLFTDYLFTDELVGEWSNETFSLGDMVEQGIYKNMARGPFWTSNEALGFDVTSRSSLSPVTKYFAGFRKLYWPVKETSSDPSKIKLNLDKLRIAEDWDKRPSGPARIDVQVLVKEPGFSFIRAFLFRDEAGELIPSKQIGHRTTEEFCMSCHAGSASGVLGFRSNQLGTEKDYLRVGYPHWMIPQLSGGRLAP